MKKLKNIVLSLMLMIFCFSLTSCGKVNFKLNFIVDGNNYAVVKTTGNEVISIPEDPSKDGFIFDGWYWDEETWSRPFTANSLLDTPITSNMNVYARFISETDVQGSQINIEGAIKLDIDGVGEVFYLQVPNKQVVCKFYDYIKVDPLTTWTLSSDINGNNIINSKTVELTVGNNILYYIFTTDKNNVHDTCIVLVHRNYIFDVYFNSNGGTRCSSVKVEEDSYLEKDKIPSSERDGYTFNGWDFDFENEPIKKSFTANAKWNPNRYKITYDANGGIMNSTTQSVYYDQSYSLYTPTKTGYTFTGWSKSGSSKIFSMTGYWNLKEDIYLIANWRINTYTITYDLKGGEVDSTLKTSYTINDTFTLPNPTQKGYTFIGWFTNSNNNAVINYVVNNGTYGNLTFYANWKVNTYTITYDVNSGEQLSDNSQIVTYDENFEIKTATRDYYTFVGWYYNGKKLTSGKYDIDSDITVVAKWETIKYTITYNLNAGANDIENPTKYDYESGQIKIKTPTRTGYTFTGWYVNDGNALEKDYVIKEKSFGDISLSANWQANTYTITFDLNGGNKLEYNNLEVIYGSRYILPEPEKTGYKFKGWYNGQELVVDGLWKIDSDANLKAKWEIKTYKINYILDGGFNSNENLQSYNYEYNDIIILNPSKTGYTFNGWKVNGNSELIKDYVIKHNSLGDISLEAVFVANAYKLMLDVNGGDSLKIREIEINYDDKFTLEEPIKKGYRFAGWYKGTSKVESGTWKYLEDVTLVAKWNINSYIIKYNLDGGINNSNNISSYNYESDDITILEPTKTGYTFLGWTYADKIVPVKEVVISHNSTGDVELTANFQVNTYYITYDVNGGNELKENVIGVVYGTSFSLVIPTRDGYEFSGWYIDSTEFTNGKWTKTEDVMLTAKWILVNYSIYYALDGGKNSSSNPVKYNYTYQDITISNPTKTGYTFIGWSVNNSEELVIDYVIKQYSFGNLVLTANWIVNEYILSYDVNGGDDLEDSEISIEYDSIYSLPIPTRIGYTFDGWYNRTTKVESGIWKYLEDVTLTAKWNVINYQIKYNLNDGENNEDNPLTYTYDDETIVLCDPYKRGYTFIGWITDSIFIPTKELEIPHNSIGEFSFEAIFEVNTYTIIFDVNGGEQLTTTEMEVVYGENVELPIPTYGSNVFLGWYHGNDKITSGMWNVNENALLIAKWLKMYNENGITYTNFGRYPQSKITNNSIIKILNTITETNLLGYYEYEGNEYKYYNGCYYLVEDLRWIVLESTNGKFKLISEKIIDRQQFYYNGNSVGGYGGNPYSNVRKINNSNIYPNNYQYSHIRAWLNGYNGLNYKVKDFQNNGFIDIAFNYVENNLIAQSFNISSDINDKIYILSSSEWSKYNSKINLANVISTDYSISMGKSYWGINSWMLRDGSHRSSGSDYGTFYENKFINHEGILETSGGLVSYLYGVRPVLEIAINE